MTGGPGTGKSTILATFLERLDRRYSIAMCAPTGKAAKRIAEVTGFEAQTVHRMLGAQGGSGGWVFEKNRDNLLSYKVVVCDESSMLDAQTCAALVDAVGLGTRLYFVGDANQLPSVGPGQVFSDLIESGKIPVARLERVHRAAMGSWVCRNAPQILYGDIELQNTTDFKYYRVQDTEKLAKTVVDLVNVQMPSAGIPSDSIQVLTPQNSGMIGVENLNNFLQSKLNPVVDPEALWKVRANKGTTYMLRDNDRVIATVNDYNRAVFNGESGILRKVDVHGQSLEIDFDDRKVAYDKEAASGLRLAYALTVHKSQGSEWDWVVVVCHSSHKSMWSRQLLYTAVTRAKKGVILIGDDIGLGAALTNDDPRNRKTTLVRRLRECAS